MCQKTLLDIKKYREFVVNLFISHIHVLLSYEIMNEGSYRFPLEYVYT